MEYIFQKRQTDNKKQTDKVIRNYDKRYEENVGWKKKKKMQADTGRDLL